MLWSDPGSLQYTALETVIHTSNCDKLQCLWSQWSESMISLPFLGGSLHKTGWLSVFPLAPSLCKSTFKEHFFKMGDGKAQGWKHWHPATWGKWGAYKNRPDCGMRETEDWIPPQTLVVIFEAVRSWYKKWTLKIIKTKLASISLCRKSH